MSTQFRTLNDIVRAFSDIAERHLQIKTFFIGQEFDLGNNTARHSILAINPVAAVMPKNENGYSSYTVDIDIRVYDLVNKDLGNEQEVMSDSLETLKDVVTELNTHPYYIESDFNLINDVSFEPARGVFDSDLTGWECTMTIEAPNRNYFCGLPMEDLNGTTYYPDLFSNVRNSDDTYNTTVIVSETLTLPDITHTDSDGSPVVLPAQTPMICSSGLSPSGIAYQRPILTGQTTSYRTGDDAWNLANNIYDYTPPIYPVSFAQLDNDSINPFTTLSDNNAFGNTNRFTDDSGGQTYSNDYVIDHLTGLGWYRIEQGTSTAWATAIDNASTSTQNSYNDWRIPNRFEQASILNHGFGVLLNYAPFNITITAALWTSTTALTDSTVAYTLASNAVLGGQFKTFFVNYKYLLVRNHYT